MDREPVKANIDINDVKALVEMAAPRGSAEVGARNRVAAAIREAENAQQLTSEPASPNGHEKALVPAA